jgi:hypothetical protein
MSQGFAGLRGRGGKRLLWGEMLHREGFGRMSMGIWSSRCVPMFGTWTIRTLGCGSGWMLCSRVIGLRCMRGQDYLTGVTLWIGSGLRSFMRGKGMSYGVETSRLDLTSPGHGCAIETTQSYDSSNEEWNSITLTWPSCSYQFTSRSPTDKDFHTVDKDS